MELANWIDGVSLRILFAWSLLTLAAVTGIMMVVVGMFEELPGIIHAAYMRSFKQRRP